MSDNNYQKDLFGSDLKPRKRLKGSSFGDYSKHRYLPYLKIPIEYTVIIAIGVMVLAIISYALGVQVGVSRGSFMETVLEEKVTVREDIPEKLFEDLRDVERDLPVIPEAPVKTVLPDDPPEEEDPADIDPYEGLRQDHLIVPPEEDAPLAEETIPPPDTVYIIQLAAFSDGHRAAEEAERLLERGVNSRVIQRGNWHQVYASGYDTIEEARAARDRFKTMYPDCYIRKVN